MENDENVDQQNTTDNRNSNDNQEKNSGLNDDSWENDIFDDTDPNLRKDKKKDPKRTLFY